MIGSDLRTVLDEVGISQADFARLIGVTPRAVSLWMVGDRVPGPAEAYTRLLQSLTPAQRQVELARLKERRTTMRDGMYGVEFKPTKGDGTSGTGICVLILDNGRAFGVDPSGAKYDGEYTFDEATRLADLRLKVTFPPNVKAVFGVTNPYEWSIDLTTQLNPHADSGQVRIATPIGRAINARYKFLRPLPEN
jgi:hypothetical protein